MSEPCDEPLPNPLEDDPSDIDLFKTNDPIIGTLRRVDTVGWGMTVVGKLLLTGTVWETSSTTDSSPENTEYNYKDEHS